MSSATPLFPPADRAVSQGLTGRDLVRQWCKYWGTITGAALVVSSVTIYGLLAQPATYVATAKVWVKTDQQGSPSFLSGVAAYRDAQMPDPVNRKIETEMQLLLSRSNVEAVVKKLQLTPAQLPASPLSYLIRVGADKPRTEQQLLNETVERFLAAVKVEPARSKTADTTSNLLEVQLETTDQALTPVALNALVEQYKQFGVAQTRQQGMATYALIDDKLKQAEQEINGIDKQILSLTKAQGADVELPVRTRGPGIRLADDESGLRMDTILASTRSGGESSIGMMKSQAVALEGRLEELRQVYTDDAEVVKNTRRQLSQVQARLSRGVKAGAELEAQIQLLERTRRLAQDRFVELRRKLDQIDLYLHSESDESSARVVTERAIEPDKPERKRKIILAIFGPLAGLALGFMLAGLREYFDHRLQSSQDVARYLGLETLGILPVQSGGEA